MTPYEMNAYLNSILGLYGVRSGERFSAILGENVRAARSPFLWNSMYEAMNDSTRMVPIDIQATDFENLITTLQSRSCFLGGALAIPFKQSILSFLPDDARLRLGACNIFKLDNRRFSGINSDGLGFISALESNGYDLARLGSVLVLGAGGASNGIIRSLLGDLRAKNLSIWVVNRNVDRAENLVGQVKDTWPNARIKVAYPSDEAIEIDLVVNATSFGHLSGGELDTANVIEFSGGRVIALMRRRANFNVKIGLVDIVYDPMETPLMKLFKSVGLRVQGGLAMNLHQAVIGFRFVNRHLPVSHEQVLAIMSSATAIK